MASDPLPWAFVGVIGGGVFIALGFRQWKIKRLIENTPTSKIRSIAMGFVELCGKVGKPHEKYLQAPFTGKDCVYYSYAIEEQRRDNKGRPYWATIRSDSQSVPFYVKDNTGEVLVDPSGATLELPRDFQQTMSFWKETPPGIKAFSEKNNLRLKGLFGNRPLRFTETHLIPNDTVFVLGTAGDNPHVAEGSSAKGVDDVMVHKGKHHPFYISDREEKDVLKGFMFKTYGFVSGGFVVLIACLAYILYRFGLF